jgi:hypothetical protein
MQDFRPDHYFGKTLSRNLRDPSSVQMHVVVPVRRFQEVNANIPVRARIPPGLYIRDALLDAARRGTAENIGCVEREMHGRASTSSGCRETEPRDRWTGPKRGRALRHKRPIWQGSGFTLGLWCRDIGP